MARNKGGRPVVNRDRILSVRLWPRDTEVVLRYAAQHHGGSYNAAMREITAHGLRAMELHSDQQESEPAA